MHAVRRCVLALCALVVLVWSPNARADTPPTATAVTISDTTPSLTDAMLCNYTYTDADTDAEAGSVTTWYIGGTLASSNGTDSSATAASPSSRTPTALGAVAADTITCKVVPTNANDSGTQTTSSNSAVVDSLPTATAVTVSDTTPGLTDAMLCNYTYTDANTDAESGSVTTWYVQGTLASSNGTDSSATASSPSSRTPTALGAVATNTITCKVTPANSQGTGTQTTSGNSAVVDTAPTATSVTLSDTTPGLTDAMLCNYTYTDAETDAESGSVTTWYIGGTLASSNGTDSSATAGSPSSRTPTALGASATNTITCKVTPANSQGTGTQTTSGNSAVVDTAPTATSVTLSDTTPGLTDAMLCNYTYTDAETDAESGSVTTWYIGGTLASSNGTDSSATASSPSSRTPTALGAVAADTITCKVSPANSQGTGSQTTSGNSAVVDSLPTATSITLSDTTPGLTDAMLCNYTYTDADTNTESGSVTTWYIGGTLASSNGTDSSATASSPSSRTPTALGAVATDTITCKVTPANSQGTGSQTTSGNSAVVDSLPTATSVSLSDTTPGLTDAMLCNYTYGDANTDTESGSVTTWYIGGTLASSNGTDSSATASSPSSRTPSALGAVATNTITCKVTPANAQGTGAQATSSNSAVVDTIPTATSVSLSDTSPALADSTTCNYTYTDANTDAESGSETRWYVNGSLAATDSTATASSPSSKTPSSLSAVKGDGIVCKVTPANAQGTGTQVASASATVDNTAPTIGSAAISPSGPATITKLTCTASGFSDDDTADSLTYSYTFYKNSSTSIAAGSGAATTRTLQLNPVLVTQNDSVYCIASASDGTASTAGATSNSVVVGNTAPSTGDVVLTPANPNYNDSTITCAVTSSNPASDSDNDSIDLTFEFFQATGTGTTTTGAALASTTLSSVTTGSFTLDLGTTSLNPEEFITCRVTADDGATTTATTASGLEIDNRAPNTPTVAFSINGTPVTSAKVTDVVTCDVSATDDDGDVPTYTYAWAHNPSGSSSNQTLSLSSSNTEPGATVSCTGTADDAHPSGTTSNTAALTVDNTAPVVSSVTLDQSSYAVGDTMTCTVAATDADAKTLSYDYYFLNVTSTTTIKSHLNKSGTTQTYKLTQNDINPNDSVRCDVVADDGGLTGSGSSTASGAANTDPVVTTPSISPSTGVNNETTLVCSSTVTDADGGTPTVVYSWTKASTTGTALTGASSSVSGSVFFSTLTLTTATAIPTDSIFCKVQATDANSGVDSDNSSVTVDNRAPTIDTSASLDDTTPQVTDVVTCSASATDPDGQALTEVHAWTNGASSIGSTNVLTVTTANSDPNDVLTCTVTYTDPQNTTGDGESSTLATATVQNTVPVVSNVVVGPSGSHTTVTNLTCTVTATDPDALTLNYSYQWLRNGTAMSGGSTSSIAANTYNMQLTSGNSAVSDTITCNVSVSDSLGTTLGSDTTQLGNQAPSVSSVSILPTTVYTDSTVTCDIQASEPDSDPMNYDFVVRNGSTTLGSTSSISSTRFNVTLNNTTAQPADVITCEALARDPDGGTDDSSTTVTVSNTTPTVDGQVTIKPTAAATTSTILTCVATASDVDAASSSGDPTLSYAWWNMGTVASGTAVTQIQASGSILTLDNTKVQPEEYARCFATATDALDNSLTATKARSKLITNTDPVVTATVSAATPEVMDSLGVTCVTSDADGDTPTITYSWAGSIQGNLGVASSSIATLETESLVKHETVSATCIATDAHGGVTTDADTATIANTSPTVTVSISPSANVTVTSQVSCSSTEQDDDDADDGSLSTGYHWETRSGTTTVTFATGSQTTLSTTVVSAGDSVYCVGTVTDPEGATGVDDELVNIENSQPTVTGTPSLTPATPVPSSALTCTAPAFSDPDDPSLADSYTFSFVWLQGSTTMQSSGVYSAVGSVGATDVLSGGISTGDATWTCEVTITDGGSKEDSGDYEFTVCYEDSDQDEFGDPATFHLAANAGDSCDNSGSNLAEDAYDCDDTTATTKPGIADLDSNNVASANGNNGSCMKDIDGDQYGDDQTPTTANSAYVAGDDCDDSTTTGANNTYLGAAEVVNDGIDQDCDGLDSCYVDSDGDGYGDSDTSNNVDSVTAGGTYASPAPTACDDATNGVADDALDCHDNEATANPAAAEICDGLDTNCDNGGTPPVDEIDNDGDSYVECSIVNNFFSKNNQYTHTPAVNGGGDCVDDPAVLINDIAAVDISPGFSEDSFDSDGDGIADDLLLGDGVDNNCDQSTPADADGDGLIDGNYHNPAGDECYQDNDQDGQGDYSGLTTWDTQADGCNKSQGEAGAGLNTDCNDEDSTVNVGAVELCDGQLNDCDGTMPPDETDDDGDGYIECCPNALFTPEGSEPAKLTFVYGDTDGLANGAAYEECAGFAYAGDDANVVGGGDCDDGAAQIGGTGLTGADVYPALGNEECEAGEEQVDNDCNGDKNSYWNTNTGQNVDVVGDKNFYPDVDGDGFGDENAAPEKFCSAPSDYDSAPVDCDDRDADIFPGQNEFCNGRDDDCDGAIDNDDAGDIDPDNSGCLDYYRDSDGDLYGDEEQVECLCATDRCSDGEDNDNDGVADNDDPDCAGPDGDEVDSTGSKYVDAGLDFVQYSNYYYISRQFDCYDLDSAIFPDSGVTRNSFDVVTHRVETLDGHDNDCDGLMAVAELDCDDDGSLAMLPLPLPDGIDELVWAELDYEARLAEVVGNGLQLDDSSVVGLPRCDTTMKANYQIPAASINCWPNNAKLNLECDDATGLWMVSYQTDDGQGGIFDGGHHEFVSREVDGDCDDTCGSRFPGADEICDGIDNDCSDAVLYYSTSYDPDAQKGDVLAMERDGVPDAMDTAKKHFGSVTSREFDMDGDGFVGCGDYIGSLNEQDVKTDASCSNALDTSDDTLLSDCNNFCALATPVAEEACNGFDDLCFEGLEGSDSDNDGMLSCGAWSQGSGADYKSEYFVLTVVNTAAGGEENVDTGDTGAVASGWPSHLPNSIPLFEPRPIYVNPALSGTIPETCDDPLDRVLEEIYSYYTGSSGDWMLEFCACVEGLENDFGDCSLFEAGGECVVVKVGLAEDDDQQISTYMGSIASESQGWEDPETWSCASDYPEQVVTRSVWNPERILESRKRVVEWECLRLYGHTCTELAENPDLAGTVNVEGTAGETGVSAEISRDAPVEWPVTFGRYTLSVVSEGNILGCWGDPSAVGLEAVDDYIGGDCDNADSSSNMYELEGPADLYGVWRSSLPPNGRYGRNVNANKGLYLELGELDCRTCLDGIDNNCDGQADCDDPACAPCFVGQGFGFGSSGESPCAQPGCTQVAAAPSATRGFTGLALLASAVLLTGLVGRRREEHDEAPEAK